MPARLTEVHIARASFAVLALHFVDANFLQPRPGTSAGDHLTSGLCRRDPRCGWGHLPAAPCRRSGFHCDDVRSTRDRDRLPRCLLPPRRHRIGSSLQRLARDRGRCGVARDGAGDALAKPTDGSEPSAEIRPSCCHGRAGHARCRCDLRLRRLPNRLLIRLHACRPHRAAGWTLESRSRP